eukprot:CAMPEP_0181107824 /NCGR_PEP_ID=MMETSP1071-20121207/17293_1 /TAXON_ID=35127 /ORGANISM="Thalassiosira sp., Strain NH16" /LENGTH=47 /DNA_ID= /DNA_START= /DNA_END= /DNA_ORIENTATION=
MAVADVDLSKDNDRIWHIGTDAIFSIVPQQQRIAIIFKGATVMPKHR